MTVTRCLRRTHLLAAALVSVFVFAGPAPAAAQQTQLSILDRQASWEEFENRRIGFLASDYRVVDVESCSEPNGAQWWVAIYHHLSRPRTASTI